MSLHQSSNRMPDDYLPQVERRSPAPITHLPVNALTDDTDPTREIRSLIEQLQITSKDSRAKMERAEHERDDYYRQLDAARREIDQLRSHFVEITSLIRERDAAQAEGQRHAQMVRDAEGRLAILSKEHTDLQRQRDDAVRQREDAVRQREEALRMREDLVRSRDEAQRQLAQLKQTAQSAGPQITEIQQQLLSVRQARDTALTHNRDLTGKLRTAEQDIEQLQYDVESAESKAVTAVRELTALREQSAAWVQEKETAAREMEALRKEVQTLSEQSTSAVDAAALAELDAQLARVAAERNSAVEQLQQQIQESESMRAEMEQLRAASDSQAAAELDEMRMNMASLMNDRETAEARLHLLTKETAGQKELIQDLREQIQGLERQLEFAAAHGGASSDWEEIVRERDEAVHAREEAYGSLTAAHRRIERLVQERDEVRKELVDNSLSADAQLEALRTQLSFYEQFAQDGGSGEGLRDLIEQLESKQNETRDLEHTVEQNRLAAVELGTQLHAAQQEIRKLTAALAEARIQAKFALSRASKLPPGGVDAESAVWAAHGPAPSIPAEESDHRLPAGWEAEARNAVGGMRQCFQAFSRNPADLSLLNEMFGYAHAFADRTEEWGLVAVRNLARSFAEMTVQLYRTPELVNAGVMRTAGQTIEFFGTLIKIKNLHQVKDPSTAVVYAVDDDPDNCECIALALQTAQIQTKAAHDGATALAELSDTKVDLILLDVNLPDGDGFELCARIRQSPMNAHTPVIFLTGLNTHQNRVQSTLSGGNEFIGKPFNLHELAVKATTLLLKAELQLD